MNVTVKIPIANPNIAQIHGAGSILPALLGAWISKKTKATINSTILITSNQNHTVRNGYMRDS